MTKNTLIIHLKDLANSEIEGIMNFKKTRWKVRKKKLN
jgi:hypothetical protein